MINFRQKKNKIQVMGEGQLLERLNVELPIFRNFEISNII